MCYSSLSSHGPFMSPAPFNVRPVSALHDLSPRLRFSAGPGDALYRATRCGVIFLYSIDYICATFVLTTWLRFCNLHTWTTGKAGNTAPRGQVPTPTRRTYRLSGREALSNRGVGAKEAPPQARTRLTRAGGSDTAGRPQTGRTTGRRAYQAG